MNPKKKHTYLFGYSLAFLLIVSLLFLVKNWQKTEPEEPIEGTYFLGLRTDTLSKVEGRIQGGITLSDLLEQFDLPQNLITRTISTASGTFEPTQMKAGHTYYAYCGGENQTQLRYLIYGRSQTDFVVFDFSDSIRVYLKQKPVKIIRKMAEGVIRESLWNSISQSGHNTELCYRLATIYAWQIDFFSIRKGDHYKVIYDELVVDDSVSIDIGRIHGAVFGHNDNTYYAIPFEQDSVLEYYDENGRNLRKSFLKAPLRFSRISSRFSNSRRHPVLRIRRPHHGVDYAAPRGTPVVSIGNGVVVAAGYQRGGGNYVKIKHNATYSSTYMHLSRMARGIRRGARVQQGQRIGYVGSTGLSTGPHLDFRIYKKGKPIDPLKVISPPVNTLKPEYADSFRQVRNRTLNALSNHLSTKKQ